MKHKEQIIAEAFLGYKLYPKKGFRCPKCDKKKIVKGLKAGGKEKWYLRLCVNCLYTKEELTKLGIDPKETEKIEMGF